MIIPINIVANRKNTTTKSKLAGNLGENEVTILAFTFSDDWNGTSKTIVYKTPAGELKLPVDLEVDNTIEVDGGLFDAVGTLSYTVYGSFGNDKVINASGELLVGEALANTGGLTITEFTDIIGLCNTATQEAITAKDAAVLATERIETTDADIKAAEVERVQAEGDRVTAEQSRSAAEGTRASAETSRGTAESNRVTAEGNRVTAENGRVNAESSRVTAEQGRAAYATDLPKNGPILTNKIVNGTFDTQAAWMGTNKTISGGVARVQCAAGSDAYLIQLGILTVGRSYYCAFDCVITSGSFRLQNKSAMNVSTSGHKSYVFVSDAEGLLFDNENSTATDFTIDNVLLVDLTAFFGAGNEPTVLQMDRLASYSGYFAGNINITDVIQCLIAEKASKAQEAWITPTLLNGAANHVVGGLKYKKNSIGRVLLKGSLTTLTAGSACMVLPEGYRPSQTLYFVGNSNNGGLAYISISSSGSVVVHSAYTLNHVSFDLISFEAEA